MARRSAVYDQPDITSVAAVVALATLLLCVWLLIACGRKRREAEARLAQLTQRVDQTVAARTEELTGLTRHLLTQREEERARIARELHDELGSTLTAVNMDLAWVRQRLSDPALASRLARAAEVLTSSVEMKRRIIHELRPTVLDNLGLSLAIESHAAEYSRRIGIPIETRVPEDLPPVSGGCPIALFRIFQQALANAAAHAQATRISVSLSHESTRLVLEISDDGVGVDPDAARGKAGCYGLLDMRERTLQMGGTISVERGPAGTGTVVRVELPCVAATGSD